MDVDILAHNSLLMITNEEEERGEPSSSRHRLISMKGLWDGAISTAFKEVMMDHVGRCQDFFTNNQG